MKCLGVLSVPLSCRLSTVYVHTHGQTRMPPTQNVFASRVFGQVVRGKALWRGKFKHKETMVVTRVDVSGTVKTTVTNDELSCLVSYSSFVLKPFVISYHLLAHWEDLVWDRFGL